MALVLIADDAYVFMVAWEAMALASYFLVTTEHRIPEIRRAGLLYLVIAHIGAIAILLCFGVLQGGSGDYTFGSMVPAAGGILEGLSPVGEAVDADYEAVAKGEEGRQLPLDLNAVPSRERASCQWKGSGSRWPRAARWARY